MQRLQNLYSGQAVGSSSDFPNGKFRNRQFVGDNTGTPLEVKWANNIWGALSALLKGAGLTANDQEETANNSQVLQAVRRIAGTAVENSFYYGTSSNPVTSIECHALLRTSKNNDDWFNSDDGTVNQFTQGGSNNALDLPLPFGRFQINYFAAYVVDHDANASSRLEITLRRRNRTTNSTQTIGTLIYNTIANQRSVSLVHNIENGYYYFVHIEPQNGNAIPSPKIRDVWVQLSPIPVTI